MEDFERTDLRKVKDQMDNHVGFVVGEHNYGRVDKMTDEELGVVAASVGSLIEQASRLLDAIGIETFARLSEQSAE